MPSPMSTSRKTATQRKGLTLERALVVAMAVHLLFGGIVTWWPGLLPAAAATPEETRPLEFRFVDTPDREEPETPPETETTSDRDRRAADMSERDDQPTPYSEGNTPESVMRLPQPASQPSPEQPPAEPSPATEQPPAETTSEQPEAAEEPAVTEAGDTATPQRPEEQPAAETTPAATPPQPNRNQLLRSLTSLERYAAPQVTDNRSGGAPGPQSLAEFDTKGIDLGPYLREVLRRIELNWRANIPPLIRTGIGGSSFVALSIRRTRDGDGNEVATIVAERTWSSGQPAYDSAALFALELSNPLPPIPEFFPYDSIEGRLGFIYNLDPERVRFPEDRQ